MDIEREKLSVAKEEAWLKLQLEQKKIADAYEMEQKRMADAYAMEHEKNMIARSMEEQKIMFQDVSLLDEASAKWILMMKKKISDRDIGVDGSGGSAPSSAP